MEFAIPALKGRANSTPIDGSPLKRLLYGQNRIEISSVIN
jgi:hypothetical protein